MPKLMLQGPRTPPGAGAALRGPALVWALMHGALAAALFAGPLAAAAKEVPARFAWALWPGFVVQAGTLAALLFLVTAPLSLLPRVYRVAVPVAGAVAALVLFVDAVVYRLVRFHINGFFFRVLMQPRAMEETGVSPALGVAIAAGAIALLALQVWAFPRFARLLGGRPRRVLVPVVALVLLGTAERFASATLSYFGGPGVFAAGQTMPLQAPVRMNSFLAKLTGRSPSEMPDPFSGAARDAAGRLPVGIAPSAVKLEQTPDILFVVAESLRADFFDQRTMPRLWARSQDGAVFENHYSTAPATFYGLFSLLFGLHGHKADAVIGSGRSPLLFSALKANGYQMHLVSASGVEWMGLKDGAFGEVASELETDWGGPFDTRDDEMMRRARAWVERGADPRKPAFLFLFFFGTHFDYFHPPRSAVFSPAWDGKGSIKATSEPGERIRNRARNAAHEVDWKLDEFIQWYESVRGRKPLVVFTGDHGEEFRERGRLGHGSDVNWEQIAVPMVFAGEGAPRGRFTAPTSHTDVMPTLFWALGDRNSPDKYSDGTTMTTALRDRFVFATVGWEPTYAAIGADVKVRFAAVSAFGRVQVTDPYDRPLPGGADALPKVAPAILRILGKDAAR